ncbi:hypothetical protein IPA_08905 [Ignicoccus pacificus DSM 13166]|uniref:Uncharacterized protein n=1 Tax=Ignicoccus pacificus DSM 13166 TaxID=940294 RepID=A0A977KC27_9CREN|nr:hypothetical protein IPA_08905 [Ignicoccus pacificus DSM 13166]
MAYDLEMQDSKIRIKGSEERVMIVPTKMIAEMGKEFYKIVGDASKVMMREIGKCLGEYMTEVAISELKKEVSQSDLRDLLNAIATFLARSGFGKISVEEEDDGSLKIVVEDAPSKGSNVDCSFEEGVVKGVLEKMTGKKYMVRKLGSDGSRCVVLVKEYK